MSSPSAAAQEQPLIAHRRALATASFLADIARAPLRQLISSLPISLPYDDTLAIPIYPDLPIYDLLSLLPYPKCSHTHFTVYSVLAFRHVPHTPLTTYTRPGL